MTSTEFAFAAFLWGMVAFIAMSIIFGIVAIVLMWRNR